MGKKSGFKANITGEGFAKDAGPEAHTITGGKWGGPKDKGAKSGGSMSKMKSGKSDKTGY